MKDLFGNIVLPVHRVALKGRRLAEVAYATLIKLYGSTPGKKCRDCKYLHWKVVSKQYPKCTLSGCAGSSRSSDWNSRWQACGKFEENDNGE
jgi:hypothetical protein